MEIEDDVVPARSVELVKAQLGTVPVDTVARGGVVDEVGAVDAQAGGALALARADAAHVPHAEKLLRGVVVHGPVDVQASAFPRRSGESTAAAFPAGMHGPLDSAARRHGRIVDEEDGVPGGCGDCRQKPEQQ